MQNHHDSQQDGLQTYQYVVIPPINRGWWLVPAGIWMKTKTPPGGIPQPIPRTPPRKTEQLLHHPPRGEQVNMFQVSVDPRGKILRFPIIAPASIWLSEQSSNRWTRFIKENKLAPSDLISVRFKSVGQKVQNRTFASIGAVETATVIIGYVFDEAEEFQLDPETAPKETATLKKKASASDSPSAAPEKNPPAPGQAVDKPPMSTNGDHTTADQPSVSTNGDHTTADADPPDSADDDEPERFVVSNTAIPVGIDA